MFKKIYNLLGKLFCLVSVTILLIALLERILNFFNLTFSWIELRPARLLEFAVMFLVFGIFFVLVEIRDEMKKLVQKK